MFVALALPFFLVDVPPVLDYPNHLARLYVLAFGAGDPALSAMYAPHWQILPNLAIDLVGPPLMHVLPVHVVGRLLLAAAAVLPVVGVVLYHRAVFGVRAWWPLASAVIAFNGVFFFGFINYLYAVGLAFVLTAFWIALRERHAIVAIAGSALGVAVLFFCHVAGPLLFALLAGAHEVAALWRLRGSAGGMARRAASGLTLLAALLPAVLLYALSPLAGVRAPPSWVSPLQKLGQLLTPFATYDIGLTLVSTVVIVAVAATVIWRRPRIDAGTALAFVVAAILYVVAPRKMDGGSVVDIRITLVVVLMVFAGLAPRLSRQADRLAAAVAALFLVRVADAGVVWFEHRTDVAELRAAIAPVEAGARVLVVNAGIGAPPAYLESERPGRFVPAVYRVDEHLPALLVIERHAFWPQLFADPRQQPLVVKPAYAAVADSLGEPRSVSALASDRPVLATPAPYLEDWPAKFNYVLVLEAGAMATTALRPDRLQLVDDSDFAALYRILPPPP